MNLISELESVLREEQGLLLNGEFERLEGLIDRKTKLSARLAQERPDLSAHAYRHLAERARQNEALLESARRGLQAAMRQLQQPLQQADQTTYSKSGHRNTLSRAPSSVTQKI
jgi:hypothetical protein